MKVNEERERRSGQEEATHEKVWIRGRDRDRGTETEEGNERACDRQGRDRNLAGAKGSSVPQWWARGRRGRRWLGMRQAGLGGAYTLLCGFWVEGGREGLMGQQEAGIAEGTSIEITGLVQKGGASFPVHWRSLSRRAPVH